jgi:hypothetical protein
MGQREREREREEQRRGRKRIGGVPRASAVPVSHHGSRNSPVEVDLVGPAPIRRVQSGDS